MGRPKKAPDESRTDRLPAPRVTAAERAFVEAEASAAGVGVAEFIRRRALGQRVTAKRVTADDQLLLELNRVGTNLNQIARAVNMDRLPNDLHEIIAEVREAVAKVAGGGDGS